jgi:hypothetical protein
MIGYAFVESRFVGTNMRPYSLVLPSRAVVMIGTGGFHPAATRRAMSAFSIGITMRPLARTSRSTTTGGVSGVEYVSTRYRPSGETWIAWSPLSGVSGVQPFPSRPTL